MRLYFCLPTERRGLVRREKALLREAAVNEWTLVSCSARKIQSGYTGAAHTSEVSDSLQLPLCQSSLSIIHNSTEPMCETTPREKRPKRLRAKYTSDNPPKMTCAHSFTFFSTFLCPFLSAQCSISRGVKMQTRAQSNSAQKRVLTRARPPGNLFTRSMKHSSVYAEAQARHRELNAHIQMAT